MVVLPQGVPGAELTERLAEPAGGGREGPRGDLPDRQGFSRGDRGGGDLEGSSKFNGSFFFRKKRGRALAEVASHRCAEVVRKRKPKTNQRLC